MSSSTSEGETRNVELTKTPPNQERGEQSQGDDHGTENQHQAEEGVASAEPTYVEEAPIGAVGATDESAENPLGDKHIRPSSATRSVNSVTDNQCDQGYVDREISEGSFLGQFFASVLKNIIQKFREPLNLILEVFLPVLFIVGIVIIWVLIPNDDKKGDNLLNETDIFTSRATPWKPWFWNANTDFCVNTSAVANSDAPAAQQQKFLNAYLPCNFGNPGDPTIATANRSYTMFVPVAPYMIPMVAGPPNATTLVQFEDPDSPFRQGEPEWLCYEQTSLQLCVNKTKMYQVVMFDATASFSNSKEVVDLDTMILLMLAGRNFIPFELSEIYQSTFSGLWRFGRVHFVNNTDTAAALASFKTYLHDRYHLFQFVEGSTFPTNAEANNYITDLSREGDTWGIVDMTTVTDKAFAATLQMNRSGVPWTIRIRENLSSGGLGSARFRYYFSSGFVSWQRTLNEFYFNYTGRQTPLAPAASPMPYVDFTEASFLMVAGVLAPLLIVLSFLYPVSQQTKRIVEEKEKRIREAMMIMGLGPGSFYMSWVLTYNLLYLVTSLISAILFKFTVYPKSSFFIIFFLYYFFCMSCISLASLMSSLFSKSRMAATISPLLFFVVAIPFFAIRDAPALVLNILSLLSPSAFAIGVNLLSLFEIGPGMGSEEFTQVENNFSMAQVYFYLIFDAIWYFLLTLWLDRVLPSEWGTKDHPCFCFINCFRACSKAVGVPDGSENDARDPAGQYEPEPKGRPAVQLRGLRKEFTRGTETFTAVNDLTLNLYEGQISVILGHNGAGKTTAINLMTGMLEPTAGDCLVYGKSIRDNMRAVRQEIGFCPQHNILWDEMTCREHLSYFGKLKGLSGEDLDDAVLEMIKAVDLFHKIDEKANSLSGGMKRKLSVAIAFVGKSRVVFLDEPTAGMDVGARRHTWDLIRRMSAGRSIVLTTHYMDEADLLGHSIAIMSKGRLKCKGSSMFLKSRLGVGYTLSCAIDAAADIEQITHTIEESVPDAEVVANVSGEISFRLPMADVPTFPVMLNALEANMTTFGIRSFGISVTTIEEVFMRIAHTEEEEAATTDKTGHDGEGNAAVEVDPDAWHKCKGAVSSFGRQFKTLFIKRVHNAKRDRRTQFFQIVLPILCLMLAMLMSLVTFPDAPALELSPAMYEKPQQTAFADCGANFTVTADAWKSLYDHPPVDLAEDYQTTNATEFSLRLQSTYKNHGLERMTAIVCGNTTGLAYVLHNSSGRHSLPEALQQYYRTNIKANYGTDVDTRLTTAPMKLSTRERAFVDSITTLLVGIFIMIPFTFIPSTFVSYAVKERECKAKHLQTISGMNHVTYWCSNFCFDIISFIGTDLLAILVFVIFQREEYIGDAEKFGGMFTLFLFYGIAGVSGSYLASFLFDNHASAQNVVMLANFICGFVLVILNFFLIAFEDTKDVGEALKFVFRIVPSYCLGDGIIQMASRDLFAAFGAGREVFHMDVLGWNLVYMAIEFPVFFAATLLFDHPSRLKRAQQLFHKPDERPPPIEGEDEDVALERAAVENNERPGDLVVVKGMCKVYPTAKGHTVAVKNLTFGVKPAEVFGFLGTNGAGKTTTMSILCGEQLPTNGRGFIAGNDCVDDAEDARRAVGYCPQFDALLDLLNPEEHLRLYSGLRGIAADEVDAVVSSLIAGAGLEPHRYTLASEMSGGNRRKLSVAIALIGAPQVVFLDEPSAGMDPMARRQLWAVIQAVAAKCSVVLTTHHLEEVEALANRVAIMVNGEMRCIGSLQQLKHKYGSGFEMSVRVESERRVQGLRNFMLEDMPGAKEEEYRQQKFTYSLPPTTKLSETFGLIERVKENLGITDYNVSQTSLEQVFLRIGGDATAEQD